MPDEEADGFISSGNAPSKCDFDFNVLQFSQFAGNTFENQALVLAIECVKESGKLIKSNYRNKEIQVQFKGITYISNIRTKYFR